MYFHCSQRKQKEIPSYYTFTTKTVCYKTLIILDLAIKGRNIYKQLKVMS